MLRTSTDPDGAVQTRRNSSTRKRHLPPAGLYVPCPHARPFCDLAHGGGLTSGPEAPFYRREIGTVTFGELLERHEREIFAYVLRLTGNRADADDLYQETFLAAFRGWPPPRGGNERAWLYKIATNKAIDRVRRTRRLVPIADLRLAAPERDGVTLSDMATAVRALPTGQRAAFVLRKVEGRSYAEVADVLGCSEEAARSRVAEAMKKVKEAVR
jgi:RNA polymerase sigma-70 factor, ECF subfamily